MSVGVQTVSIEEHEELMRQFSLMQERVRHLVYQKERAERHLHSMVNIGQALSIEKDFESLLRKILQQSKLLTGADAGSIFLVEKEEEESDVEVLRFKISHTFSKDLPYEKFHLPLDTKSIAGYVAVTGRILNIPDVYKLTQQDPIQFNSTFDQTSEYRSKSMLVVPMKSHNDKIIGVIQLINCKDIGDIDQSDTAFTVRLQTESDYEEKVVAFPGEHANLLLAIASQAAIAIENNRMIRQIEQLFEQFVKASVSAIESRDPVTSGHSFRVAEMSVRLARAVNSETEGSLKDISFSEPQLRELEYAGLLHDFGKVYLEAAIFSKAKKLFPKDFLTLKLRLSLLYRDIELTTLRLGSEAPGSGAAVIAANQKLATVRGIIDTVTRLNEPTVTDGDPEKTVAQIRAQAEHLRGTDLDGNQVEVLTDEEAINLMIRRGTLNPAERKEIESHVVHSYNFLARIPWPDDLKNIPDIAGKHHEMLDGSGYPDGAKADEISIQSRIMTVADIFDALHAADRPYKKAVPLEKCYTILREEVTKGRLDHDLVEVFISTTHAQEPANEAHCMESK